MAIAWPLQTERNPAMVAGRDPDEIPLPRNENLDVPPGHPEESEYRYDNEGKQGDSEP